MNKFNKTILFHSFFSLILSAGQASSNDALEEIIVTAQKREQSLQDTPIAISVLSDEQLAVRGITSLDLLSHGIVPSLNIMPIGVTTSTLITTIRGNGGPLDTTQVTREGSVAFYQNGIYLGRSQGLTGEMINIERIEVLRGPQGTLFGRNAVGGAVSIITKAPTGELGLKQKISFGRFNELHSATHIDLPNIGPIKTSVDYVHSERDGWVDNTASGVSDYGEYDKDGGRINLLWDVSDVLSIDYAYEQSDIESTQLYFQIYEALSGPFGPELNRETKTRVPIETLDPTVVDQHSHTLIVNWSASENVEIKSLTSHRLLEEETNSNWGGSLNFFGLIFNDDIEQEQLSQEFQIVGKTDRLDWAGGLYYFKENADQSSRFFGSLAPDFSPITPPISFGPPTIVNVTAKSVAAYGQVTWAALMDKAYLTIGLRYSEDEKSGTGDNPLIPPVKNFDYDSDHFDTSFIFEYRWTDDISTYIKRATAYKAGGVNGRSANFIPYEKEVIETWEIGAKSEWWDRRVRLNTAVFRSDYDDMQQDVLDPGNPMASETINSSKNPEINGAEVDLEVAPFAGLVLGLNYTYLDGDMPLQPNPFAGGALERFEATQTPQHAGSLTADYTFSPLAVGTLSAHANITSTDRFSYVPQDPDRQRFDAYTLVNARITLSNIPLGNNSDHALNLSLWGRNLTDEEYIVFALPIANGVHAFGTPRTTGIDITYQF